MSNKASIRIDAPGVNVAVVKKDSDGWKFLILKRAETESHPGCCGFLTGGKHGNETVAQVVVREMAEETGLTPTAMWSTEYVVHFYEPEFDAIWILPLIVAVVEPNAQVMLSPENSEYQWLSAEKAKRWVSWRNLVHAIDDVSEELAVYPARNWVQLKV
jgi:dATP pyrophosphohydrolase